jgi:hypothetical protein
MAGTERNCGGSGKSLPPLPGELPFYALASAWERRKEEQHVCTHLFASPGEAKGGRGPMTFT